MMGLTTFLLSNLGRTTRCVLAGLALSMVQANATVAFSDLFVDTLNACILPTDRAEAGIEQLIAAGWRDAEVADLAEIAPIDRSNTFLRALTDTAQTGAELDAYVERQIEKAAVARRRSVERDLPVRTLIHGSPVSSVLEVRGSFGVGLSCTLMTSDEIGSLDALALQGQSLRFRQPHSPQPELVSASNWSAALDEAGHHRVNIYVWAPEPLLLERANDWFTTSHSAATIDSNLSAILSER